MVFPSIPVYLDPPNWHQETNQQHQANGSDSSQLLPPLPPQAQSPHMGSIRPGSMADRAQVAKIAPPEAALKCPRCESTNTKFCYFNNYSLSQPRHFCKTCRRYWTRGGALRNVPVGGGCRRNKKNKRSRSKSPAPTEKHSLLTPNSTSAVAVPSGATSHELIGRFPQQPSSNRAFMASLQNMSRYGTVGNMGQTEHMGFQLGGGAEQWRLQQFPFFSGFESANSTLSSSSPSFPFQSDYQSVGAASAGLVGLGDIGASSRVTQMPPIKIEGNGGLSFSRSPLSLSENNQYYSWTDLSGLASSSAGHLL